MTRQGAAPPDYQALLVEYGRALSVAIQELSDYFDMIGRSGLPVGSLSGLTKTGSIERSGHLPSGAEFDFHGIGCLVVTPYGVEVDFDWTPDGRQVFDAWRFTRYIKSRGWEACEQSKIVAVISRAENEGMLTRYKDDFFAFTAK